METSYPEGWHKTLEDLRSEKRRYTGEEMRWARSYEREQLKKSGVRFPVDGEIYEAACNVEIMCLTHWRAPFTGGDRVTVISGTQIRIEVREADPEPIAVYARPLEYESWESKFVPLAVRESAKYDGYSLSVKTSELSKSFRLFQK